MMVRTLCPDYWCGHLRYESGFTLDTIAKKLRRFSVAKGNRFIKYLCDDVGGKVQQPLTLNRIFKQTLIVAHVAPIPGLSAIDVAVYDFVNIVDM